jgi:hypothetical protein
MNAAGALLVDDRRTVRDDPCAQNCAHHLPEVGHPAPNATQVTARIAEQIALSSAFFRSILCPFNARAAGSIPASVTTNY